MLKSATAVLVTQWAEQPDSRPASPAFLRQTTTKCTATSKNQQKKHHLLQIYRKKH
ncbi:MAG: hypothetical protein PUF55_09285 [Bacteroidales bacterium]|nr:hypothetical protein [Bacteroidales bacterium]